MSQGTLTKVIAKKAGDVCKAFVLGDLGKSLLREDLSPRQFLDLLVGKQQWVDAVRLLAHGLPKREAVWWACQCARAVAGPRPADKIGAALQAAEKWVKDPSEENRRAAQAVAEAADVGTPAGCAALAAFFSGGSMGPANVPVIPPGEQLTGQTVAGSVMLATVQTEPEKAPDKYRKFTDLGIDVANGKSVW